MSPGSDRTIQYFHVLTYRSEAIQKVTGDYFNCTTPIYQEISPIFQCNMLQECYSGLDEDSCSYKTQQCGQDAIDLGTDKYVYCLAHNRNYDNYCQYLCQLKIHFHDAILVFSVVKDSLMDMLQN